MRTTITVRRCEVTDALRERARVVAGRLAGLSPHALNATVVFALGPQENTAEIRLHARGRKLLVGTGAGPDHRSALDQAEARLRPQLIKATDIRRQTRRATSRSA